MAAQVAEFRGFAFEGFSPRAVGAPCGHFARAVRGRDHVPVPVEERPGGGFAFRGLGQQAAGAIDEALRGFTSGREDRVVAEVAVVEGAGRFPRGPGGEKAIDAPSHRMTRATRRSLSQIVATSRSGNPVPAIGRLPKSRLGPSTWAQREYQADRELLLRAR